MTRQAPGSYAKGRQRREQLIDAAASLLERHTPDALSLKDIAARAGIPVGSAYHFFSNANDVFAALAQRFGDTLFEVLEAPYPDQADSWQTVLGVAIERAAQLYRGHPAYQQLILGGKAPPDIKLADRVHDQQIGHLLLRVVPGHEDMPEGAVDRFFFATEIVDLMFTLSVMRHGTMTEEMVNEAKLACVGYLGEYLHHSKLANHQQTEAARRDRR